MSNRTRDERGLTGLDAAIVLIAFIVVASVFAYVTIDSGLYAAQKSREVTENSVNSITSLQPTGQAIHKSIRDAMAQHSGAQATVPVADFFATPASGSSPLTVSFEDHSSGAPIAWQWDFGDGTANSTSQNPVHTYSAPGSYTVTLTVYNNAASGTIEKPACIQVLPQ